MCEQDHSVHTSCREEFTDMLQNNRLNDVNELGPQILSKFRETAEELSRLAATEKIKIVPYHDSNLHHFSKLPLPIQQKGLGHLLSYLQVCQLTLQSGVPLSNLNQFVWGALKAHKLCPSADLFNYLSEGSFIEIHNRENVQIFRSLNFYNLCSYTIEEMASFPWTELYVRNQSMEDYLLAVVKKSFSGTKNEVVALRTAPHLIEEKFSEGKFRVEVVMKFLAPLLDEDGQVAAHILIEDAERLE